MCEEIKIYVADLAAYNNGKLHGVWINALDNLDDIQDQINQMLDESPEQDAEEYAFTVLSINATVIRSKNLSSIR